MAKEKKEETAEHMVKPEITDPKWTDYVLSLVADNEKENGSPRTDALRRVAVHLLGHFNSETLVVQSPGLDGRATVVVKLSFQNPSKTVDGAADVCTANTNRDFAVHAVATAETRAEGRALRKALLLTRVLAAEELQGPTVDEPRGTDIRIQTGMVTGLIMMCRAVGVDLNRIVAHKFKLDSPEDMTQKQGLELSSTIDKYKRKEEVVPDEVKI